MLNTCVGGTIAALSMNGTLAITSPAPMPTNPGDTMRVLVLAAGSTTNS